MIAAPLAIDFLPDPLVQSGPQIRIFTATWSSPQVQSSPQISGYCMVVLCDLHIPHNVLYTAISREVVYNHASFSKYSERVTKYMCVLHSRVSSLNRAVPYVAQIASTDPVAK